MEKLTNKVAEVINYELEMLHYTATQISLANNRFLHDSLLESFLLHARCLIEFFYTEKIDLKTGKLSKPRNDALYASKYCSWNEIRPTNPLQTEYKSMHKYLAHVTLDRITGKKQWRVSTIYEKLMNLVQRFHMSLAQEDQQQLLLPSIKLQADVTCTSGTTIGASHYVTTAMLDNVKILE